MRCHANELSCIIKFLDSDYIPDNISDQLGHKSVKTTLDVYYNPTDEDKKNNVMKITGIDNFLLQAKANMEAEVEETYDESEEE